ncbi:unnamed protein product [Porites evermanni]|uniref:Eukaryotic translation initiation factor 2-alpha kinase 4 n=1 Tax=Porites evermanni TaxID=104178 RepID=A0ABN8Q2B2_9CNID|nr:unnamed protein product [Porites evermanni]
MEESCSERQENELQAIQAIYMDDFQDLREKPEHPPKVCLKLTPLQSVVAKEVYARVELIVQYSADYPDRSPKISLCNATGISDEDLSKLQNELQLMAADLVGEVMVLQLAHHVQTCLHKHNKPQLSFYEKMMANKQKEEERKLAAKREKQQMEIRANKEREENEKREIEEELQRREEAMRESKRRRTVVITEKNSKADQPASTQSLKTRDGEKSPVMETPPTLQKKHSGNSIALFQPSSPKKTDTIIGPGSSILRRRRSSESLPDDSFTGTRVITFSSKGEQVVHCGKCLGQGSSGSRVYSAMNVTLGELNAVCEWSLSAATTTSNQQHDLQGRLLKQVSSVKQEILSLANRVSHPNLTHYLAINVQETASSVKVQVKIIKNVRPCISEGRLSPVNQPEHEEPVPDFSFFSGVPGKSRVKCEFEELQFLGKGGFGNVIKVRNKLDNCLYAVKRIPLNPKSSQFTKRIMREVQLISRLNHENVVR